MKKTVNNKMEAIMMEMNRTEEVITSVEAILKNVAKTKKAIVVNALADLLAEYKSAHGVIGGLDREIQLANKTLDDMKSALETAYSENDLLAWTEKELIALISRKENLIKIMSKEIDATHYQLAKLRKGQTAVKTNVSEIHQCSICNKEIPVGNVKACQKKGTAPMCTDCMKKTGMLVSGTHKGTKVNTHVQVTEVESKSKSVCTKCGKAMTDAQISYCNRKFNGVQLCFNCQKEHKTA